RQQRPDNPCILVRHRHRRPVFATALDQWPNPLASSVCFTSHPADRCPRPMHQELAEIAVAAFADAEQAFLPPGGMLARHQPQPGGKLPAVLERTRIADRGHQGRRREGANAGNRHEALTLGMRRGQGGEFLLIIGQLLLQSRKLLHQFPKHLLAQRCELVLFGHELLHHGLTKLRHPFGHHDAILMHQSMHFIDQSRPFADAPLTHAMERLDILLVDVLDRHKAHGRTRHRFRDGLGITAVVFVRLDIRLHELGRHELHLVAMFAEAARPVVRAATGFHADAYWRQLRQKGHQVMPGQALAQDDLSPLIHSHRVKHALCNVDPEYAHLWFHWTRLLWLYGFTDRELIVAHGRRSAQGRAHFITTVLSLAYVYSTIRTVISIRSRGLS